MRRGAKGRGVRAISAVAVASALIAAAGIAAVFFMWRPGRGHAPVAARSLRGAEARPDRAPVAGELRGATLVATRAPSAGSSAVASSTPIAPALAAPSLQGTDVDGAFEVDTSGRLVPGASAVRLFDYVLLASGEVPPAQVRDLVRREAERTLPATGDARAQAVDLFDRYVAYRPRAAAALSAVAAAAPGAAGAVAGAGADRRGALAALHEARREAFGDEDARRMFGESEAIAEAAMAEAELSVAELPDAERARRIADQEATLPSWLRALHARRAADAEAVAAFVAQSR
jgi:lipase chaperone LimK